MASKLVNVRLDDERQRRLEEFCRREGVKKSEAMRAALDAYLTQGVPSLVASAPGSNDSVEMVDLAGWLKDRSGLPLSLCRLRVHQGRVSIAGESVSDVLVPAPSPGSVELDGEVY